MSQVNLCCGLWGLCRDHTCIFLCGFHGKLGREDILYVEIMALLRGLEICWEKGHKRITCYRNSLHLVQLVNHEV